MKLTIANKGDAPLHFARTFKKRTGLTPAHYRERVARR